MSNEPEKVKRKLTAILSADVKGYSLLMADDEVHTIQTLKTYRSLMSDLIQQHSGRVVDNPGDNLLAEFSSAVDAVGCAVKIQNRLKKENDRIEEEKRLQYRIGVNIGDVVQDGDRIYGSGVNVAARIEGLAEPSGICISRNVYDQIKDKLNIGYEYLGDHEVKNIKDPVRVYKVLMDPEDAGKQIGERKKTSKLKLGFVIVAVFLVIIACVLGGLYWKYFYLPAPSDIDTESKVTFNLPQGPSIAVLPFVNMSKDPDQEYFCDGITENIIAVLSHIPKLMVIARNSTFAYKDKSINVQQIGRELNAQYVIEGSIQKSLDLIRITVQLIDTKSGHHMWSERYDRNFNNIFGLQDEIAIEIAKAMQIHITEGEISKTRFYGISDLQTYIKLIKANEYFLGRTKESNILARKATEELLTMNVDAHALLGFIYLQGIQLGTCESDLICFGKATEATRKALSLDANNSDAHALASYLFLVRKEHDKAISEGKIAVKLNPSNSDAYLTLGMVLTFSDRPEEAIAVLKQAIRLNPITPVWYLFQLGLAYRVSRQYENAIDMYNKCLNLQPDDGYAYLGLAISYYFIGREKKAKATAEKALNAYPDISIKMIKKVSPFKNSAETEQIVDVARKLGVPD